MKKIFNKLKELMRNNKFWYVIIAILSAILIYSLFFRKKTTDTAYEEQYDTFAPVTGYTPTYTTDTGSGISSSDVQSMIDESAKNTQDMFSDALKSSYDMTMDSIKALTSSFSESYKDLYSQMSTMQRVQEASSADVIRQIKEYDKEKEQSKKSNLNKLEKLLDKIQQNSLSWHTSNDNKRKQLESQTRLLRQQAAQEARNQGLSYGFVDDTGSAPGDTYQQIKIEGYGTY